MAEYEAAADGLELERQIQHKLAFVEGVVRCSLDDGAPLVLVGHSVGCFVIQELILRSAPVARAVARCVYLMPFICNPLPRLASSAAGLFFLHRIAVPVASSAAAIIR